MFHLSRTRGEARTYRVTPSPSSGEAGTYNVKPPSYCRGAYNEFLISRIQFYLPEMQIIIPESKILEFKEVLIFALLGVLKLRNEVNVLSSVTVAKYDHSSGVVY